MPGYTTPTGSPLSPFQAPTALPKYDAGFSAAAAPIDSQPAYAATNTIAALPKAPPRKGPSIWDKEHISETLASIGAGFFQSQNFGDGLGAAAQTIAGRTKQLRDEGKKAITYGGPGDQFEIATDARGNRTIREVPQFRAANDRAAELKNAPSAKDRADLRARALYAISTQVAPEKRAEAYRNLINNPDQFGIDATGMPSEWDDTYGTLGGMMGLGVDQSLSQERANVLARDTIQHRRVLEKQGDARVVQGDARVAQGADRVAQGAQRVAQGAERLRKVPSSVSRDYSRVQSKAQYDALPSGSKYIAPDGSQRIKR
jgi:hypothetical protein